MSLLYGLDIVPHQLATKLVYEVRRHPIQKRRRNYGVARVERPACFQSGRTLYMHPDLLSKLKGQS